MEASPNKKSFPAYIWLCLMLMPVFWLAYDATSYRTTIEIVCGKEGISYRVDGAELSAPLNLNGLKSVKLMTVPSYFRTGCELLEITPLNGVPQVLDVRRIFKFSDRPARLTGDWWVDQTGPPEPVYESEVSIPGEFKLRGVFTGRALQGCTVKLGGQQEFEFYFRGGTLNNDFGIRNDTGLDIAAPRQGDVWRDFQLYTHAALGAVFYALALIVVFGVFAYRFPPEGPMILGRFQWGRGIVAVLVFGLFSCLWIAYFVLDGRPHFQDDMGYLIRAKWLLAGRLYAEIPLHPEHFEVPYTYFINGKWISQYPIGWPTLLAIGQFFGAAWIVGPLCGLGAGYFTWRVGCEAGGKLVGLIAAILGCSSPLILMLSGSMLAQTASSLFLTLFIWLYITGWERARNSWSRLGFAGAALGIAFTMRPLSAPAVAIPAGVYGLVEMWRLGFRRRAWVCALVVILGGLLGSAPQLVDNYFVTGNPLLFAYTLCLDVKWSLNEFPAGLSTADGVMALVPDMAFGWFWPWAYGGTVTVIGLGLALVPFISGKAKQLDWLLLGICIILPCVYMGSETGSCLHGYGPRYYADFFFAMFILVARGLQVLGRWEKGGGRVAWSSFGLIAVFCLSNIATLPVRLKLYRGYNEIDNRVEKMVSDAGIKRGLILLSGPKHIMWIRASRLQPINLREYLVFADLLVDNRALVASYSDRPVFVVSDEGIFPYVESIHSAGPSEAGGE